ncbi:MAG: amino acid ABC transporter permease [Coriobacteriales bacterium]
MDCTLKSTLKQALKTALALSLVLTFVMPFVAGALTVDVTTAKSNETSSNNVLGGVPTRVTWESVVDEGEDIASITVSLPQGASFSSESTARLTVLDGVERLPFSDEPVIDVAAGTVSVAFSQPVSQGNRIRLELYKTSLPNEEGLVTLSASATYADGSQAPAALDESGNVYVKVSKASMAEQISSWLDDQAWCQAWNENTFLRTFFKPQVVVSSIPTVAMGWLISLGLVLVGFPLAIPIGLLSAFMKISNSRVLKFLAAIYTGVIRGTPLFLQIYIAFFGLPMLGINLNQYLLAIFVLAFNSGAYLCEIFRAGIQSIPKGQFEASRSLGMTYVQTMKSVIIPQTVRRVIPTMTSEFILLYKDTSLLAAVGVMELMLYSKSIVATTGSMTPYIVAACFYLIVTLPLIKVVGILENKLALTDGGNTSGTSTKKRKNRRGAFAQMKDEVSQAAAPAAEDAPAAPAASEEKGAL